MSSPITLPKLPYTNDALVPVINPNTIRFHYEKHHKDYVMNLNEMIIGTKFVDMQLEEIIKNSISETAIFNNAAQIWNHTFYWNSLSASGGDKPFGPIALMIKESYGSFTKFKEEFIHAATSHFGSGWIWLVQDGKKLEIVKTVNAETPLTTSAKPLLTIDLWEHAYYLDYQNRRADYVNGVFDKLLNWEFANSNLG